MKRIFIMLASLCLPLLFSACSGEAPTSAELLDRAIGEGKNGNWKEAQTLSARALELDPKNRNILLFSALALENTGKADDALNRVQSIAKDAPDDFMVQYTLGRMLFRQGKLEQCIAPLKNARKARPGDVNTCVLLAKASVRLKTKDAAVYLKELLSHDAFRNSPEVFNEMGVAFALRGDAKVANVLFTDKRATLPVSILNAAILNDFQLNDRRRAAELYTLYIKTTARSAELEHFRLLANKRLQEIR